MHNRAEIEALARSEGERLAGKISNEEWAEAAPRACASWLIRHRSPWKALEAEAAKLPEGRREKALMDAHKSCLRAMASTHPWVLEGARELHWQRWQQDLSEQELPEGASSSAIGEPADGLEKLDDRELERRCAAEADFCNLMHEVGRASAETGMMSTPQSCRAAMRWRLRGQTARASALLACLHGQPVSSDSPIS